MLKRVIRTAWSLLVILGLIAVLPAATAGAQGTTVTCEQEYTVQSGDWLSTIAESQYGDPLAYPAIMEATNAQAGSNGFAVIDDPAVIEVGWTLCLPSQSDVQAMMDQTGQQMEQTGQQMEQTGQMEEPELTAPEGQMLMVIRNLSKANATSTFTISGGEYGGGEQITVDHGERIELDLEPGDYRVVWNSPATSDEVNFARDFTAVPGRVARARIIPEKDQAFFNLNVNQQQMTETETQQAARPEEQLTPPSDEMLLVVNNFSKANATSTFTISGGEYAGGEQITVDHGEDVVLRLMPGDYSVVWSSPTADFTFGRSFTAVPGTVARARIVPEKDQVAFRFKTQQDEMAQAEQTEQTEQAAAETEMDREFPYEAPSGRAMLVLGNRSLANIPSTMTITGGRFGGGEQITVDPGEEVFLPVDPGEFTVQWSAPVEESAEEGREIGESVIVSRQVQLNAGETPFWWIVPEEFRAFRQVEGQAPEELRQ